MANDALVTYTEEGPIGRLLLNRPDHANAFDTPMTAQFLDALRSARDKVNLLVISAAGPDFSIGRDRDEPRNPKGPFATFSLISDLNAALKAFPGVTMSIVQGRAYGFGVGLAMKTDLCLAATSSRFMLDEVKNGIPPMFIMAEMTAHLPPKHVADLIFSSREISAAEAHTMGLISRVVPDDDLTTTADSLIGALATRDPEILKACKRYLRTLPNISSDARDSFALTEQTAYALHHH